MRGGGWVGGFWLYTGPYKGASQALYGFHLVVLASKRKD